MSFHFASVLPSTRATNRPDLVLRRAGLARTLDGCSHAWLVAAGEDLGAADQQARIDAERPADEAEHHDGADRQPAAAHGQPPKPPPPAAATAALAATILDIAAFRQIFQAHAFLLAVPARLSSAVYIRSAIPPRDINAGASIQYSCRGKFLPSGQRAAELSRFLP